VACDHPVVAGGALHRADALLRRVPARAWQCVSAGTGAKGHRYYDWAFIRLDPSDPARGGQHWLMICRDHTTGELAYYRCWTPRSAPLAVLVTVAGRRWSIEERIKTSKGLVGLDATRSAAGAAGTAGPPWPCSPTPSWSSRPDQHHPLPTTLELIP